jgi:hypothetical protein
MNMRIPLEKAATDLGVPVDWLRNELAEGRLNGRRTAGQWRCDPMVIRTQIGEHVVEALKNGVTVIAGPFSASAGVFASAGVVIPIDPGHDGRLPPA